jgi:hypothetical protein
MAEPSSPSKYGLGKVRGAGGRALYFNLSPFQFNCGYDQPSPSAVQRGPFRSSSLALELVTHFSFIFGGGLPHRRRHFVVHSPVKDVLIFWDTIWSSNIRGRWRP